MPRKNTVLIDQSVKVGNTKDHTALAYATDGGGIKENTILIPKWQKQKLERNFRDEFPTSKRYRIKLFCCGIYILTWLDLESLKEVVIDVEYEKLNHWINSYLTNFWRDYGDYPVDSHPEITFDGIANRVDGNPRAHILVNEARKGNTEVYTANIDFLTWILNPSK